MEDQFMHTLAKEQIRNLHKFAGHRGEDVIRWLEDVEEVFDRAQLQPPNKFIAIQSYLTDAALKWFRNKKAIITDWKTFKRQIVHIYQPSLDEQLSRLETRHQASDESLLEYYHDKLHLCLQVDAQMSAPLLLHYLTKDLKSSLIPHVIRRNPTTKEEFLTVALDEERIERALIGMQATPTDPVHEQFDYDAMDDRIVTLVNRVTPSSGPGFHPPTRSSPPRPLMQPVNRWPTYSSSNHRPPHSAVSSPNGRRCYFCNRLGHLAKFCPNQKNA